MSGEKASVLDAEKAKQSGEDQTRQRSTIAFPYMGLNDAVEVANAIHANVGMGECSLDQLAAWLGQSGKSSGLRVQLSAARTFGVIEAEAGDRFRLSALGRRIVDPNQARRARAEAFLTVPLYRAVFDKYRGGVLPPAAALERDMASLGVAEKQKDRARQVFERSADQAGFFEHGRDRLVEPAVAVRDDETPPKRDDGGNGGDGSGGLNLDPLLIALLKKIPKVSEGWPAAKRVRWFRAFAMNVSQVYDPDDSPVELKIESEDGAA